MKKRNQKQNIKDAVRRDTWRLLEDKSGEKQEDRICRSNKKGGKEGALHETTPLFIVLSTSDVAC